MPLFGAHLSIAGGHHRALVAAHELDCSSVQLFTKAPNQWAAKPISDDEVAQFRQLRRELGVRFALAHDSYLINLASVDEKLYRRSVEAFIEEVLRAEQLGLDYLVTHPGAHKDDTVEAGLARVATALDEVHERTEGVRVRVLLETTAGQGTSLGYRFEHLRDIFNTVSDPSRLGVCLDTCHVVAAGYGLDSEAEYRATMKEFDHIIGLKRLLAFHLNDSLKPRGSRVDRHAHIGKGFVGLEAFRLLVNDRRFRDRPMILETPKEEGDRDDMDVVNLTTLRGLLPPSATEKAS
jgi:deoxyribonuclease IV